MLFSRFLYTHSLNTLRVLTLSVLFLGGISTANAQVEATEHTQNVETVTEEHIAEEQAHEAPKEGFDVSSMIFHHIGDGYDWHFADGLVLPLPVILHTSDRGFEIFMSSKFDHHSLKYDRYQIKHGHISYELNGVEMHPLDLSITKNVASLMLSALILLIVFITMAKGYKKGLAPSGVRSWLEPVVIYIRDEVIKPSIPHAYEKFTPYLLTVFFFIWINNLLGLIPGGANLTGNIAITLFLAMMTFIITLFSAKKTYWSHIFLPHGVPVLLWPILIPIEIVGVFVKPFSLMIRLFANITAGHIIILSFLGLIFIFKSFAVGAASVAFGTFMSMLELLVAFLQAYIFTLLTAMYFGSAVETSHDNH